MSNKNQEFHIKYWNLLLERYNDVDNSFGRLPPKAKSWLSDRSNWPCFSFRFNARKVQYQTVNPYISVEFGTKDLKTYEKLVAHKVSIENDFGDRLEWYRNYRDELHIIQFPKYNADIREVGWDKLIEFHCEYMPKFKSIFSQYLD